MSEASGAPAAEVVRTACVGGVLTCTLADEAGRNALGARLLNGVADALERASRDPEIRALVITNTGNTFCAGANLKERAGVAGAASVTPKLGFEELLAAIQRAPVPVLGKINGHVVGGGNGLVAALDIALARDDVKFGFTEVRLGVAPAIISVVCLPKLRRGEALEAFLRGHRFSAARAAELGLISRALPAGELDVAMDEVLADILRGGPQALAAAKRLVYEVPALPQDEAFRFTAKLSGELFRSEEAAAGMQAFLKKQAPPWAPRDEDA